MGDYKQYRRTNIAEMRPVTEQDIADYKAMKIAHKMSDSIANVSISTTDILEGSPKIGDMIARNPNNHEDRWLVAAKYFEDNFEELELKKTLTNTTASQAKDNVKDIQFWGDGNTFKLISKASSVKEGWMKSTKAMEIKEVGCVVQVTTQQGDNVAEALTFVPHVVIGEQKDESGNVVGRYLTTPY